MQGCIHQGISSSTPGLNGGLPHEVKKWRDDYISWIDAHCHALCVTVSSENWNASNH